VICRSHTPWPARSPLRFGATAVVAKDELLALCCTLAEVERLLAASDPLASAEVAAARQRLEGRLAR